MTDELPNPYHAASPEAAGSLQQLVEKLLTSYHSEAGLQHLDSTFLPSRARTIEIIELLRRLAFPGFFDARRLNSESIRYHVGELLNEVRGAMYEQIRQALRYEENHIERGRGDTGTHCDDKAVELTGVFLSRFPELRRLLATDVQAAFTGDPAAVNTDETVFCYPGIDAIFIHRVAHELYRLQVPLLPRIMSEYAHNETGVDIHPGAQVDESFFIDHGTGVVIGETVKIGKRVKIYQGVTLGALSTKGGQTWRGRKRHPTIGDDVTIYGGAVILGDIEIGEGSTIGGTVFLTKEVPPFHTVTVKAQEIEMRPRPRRYSKERGNTPDTDDHASDFQI